MTDEPDEDENETPSMAVAPSPRAKRLLPKQWLEVVQMARSGVPVAVIADSFKVQKSTIYRGLKERHVVIGAYTTPSAQFEESKERLKLIERVRETKENDYRYTEFLQRRSIKLLMDAERDGVKASTTLEDMRALKTAMEIVRAGTDNKWRILGLDKDHEDVDRELPELPIREMSQIEIDAERDKQLMDDADLEDLEAELAAGEGGESENDEDEDE